MKPPGSFNPTTATGRTGPRGRARARPDGRAAFAAFPACTAASLKARPSVRSFEASATATKAKFQGLALASGWNWDWGGGWVLGHWWGRDGVAGVVCTARTSLIVFWGV